MVPPGKHDLVLLAKNAENVLVHCISADLDSGLRSMDNVKNNMLEVILKDTCMKILVCSYNFHENGRVEKTMPCYFYSSTARCAKGPRSSIRTGTEWSLRRGQRRRTPPSVRRRPFQKPSRCYWDGVGIFSGFEFQEPHSGSRNGEVHRTFERLTCRI